MLDNLIKSILCVAAVLVVVGCGDDKPTVKDLNSFKGNEHELKFLTANVVKITPIDVETSRYDFNGTFQYPNNLYKFVLNLNGIRVYKEVSGSEPHSFEGNIIAGKNKEGWFITQSSLPSFDPRQGITKIMLIDPLTESEDNSYKIHPKLGSVLILDKEFPKRIHKLMEQYKSITSDSDELKTLESEYDELNQKKMMLFEEINTRMKKKADKITEDHYKESPKSRKAIYRDYDEKINIAIKKVNDELAEIQSKRYFLERESRGDWDSFPELKAKYDNEYVNRLELEKQKDAIMKEIRDDYSNRWEEKEILLKKQRDTDLLENSKQLRDHAEYNALNTKVMDIENKITLIKRRLASYNNYIELCDYEPVVQEMRRLNQLDELCKNH